MEIKSNKNFLTSSERLLTNDADVDVDADAEEDLLFERLKSNVGTFIENQRARRRPSPSYEIMFRERW